MSQYCNPYFRIQTYLAFSNEFNCTTMSIAEFQAYMKIPIGVIRNDIYHLFVEAIVYFDENCDEYKNINSKHNDILEKEIDQKFKDLLVKGCFDDLRLCNDTTQSHIVISTLDEQNAFKDYVKEKVGMFPKVLSDPLYYLKDNYRTYKTNLFIDNVAEIRQAIRGNRKIKIDYVGKDHAVRRYEIFPLKISYDNLDNKYAVLSVQNGKIMVNNIDRILKVEVMDTTNNNRQEQLDLIEQKYKKVWGNSFGSDSFRVKVRFKNEANVWEKVRRDIFYREPICLEEKNVDNEEYLYYEDIVFGIDKFKSWILGYGSSVEVIEPENLKIRIIDSLKARANKYGIESVEEDSNN